MCECFDMFDKLRYDVMRGVYNKGWGSGVGWGYVLVKRVSAMLSLNLSTIKGRLKLGNMFCEHVLCDVCE